MINTKTQFESIFQRLDRLDNAVFGKPTPLTKVKSEEPLQRYGETMYNVQTRLTRLESVVFHNSKI